MSQINKLMSETDNVYAYRENPTSILLSTIEPILPTAISKRIYKLIKNRRRIDILLIYSGHWGLAGTHVTLYSFADCHRLFDGWLPVTIFIGLGYASCTINNRALDRA